MRLIVTDNSTAARTMADRIAHGKAARLSVHRIEVFAADTDDGAVRVVGTGGLLFCPSGDPPTWQPVRRAAANALRFLARSADSLILATDDPLLAVQAREAACEGRPLLLREARVSVPPFTELRQPDDLAAQAAAVDLEIDAHVSAHLTRLDPALTRADLATLGTVSDSPPTGGASALGGATTTSLARLAERGYVVGDPPWRTPAGDQVVTALAGPLLAMQFASDCDAWVDAVARGTLTAQTALDRVRRILAPLPRPVASADLDAGRLLGRCPLCDDWMGGARARIACLGCGHGYSLPRQVEALAAGTTCADCDAPMIVPVIRGRRADPRCPDTSGCPSRLEVVVGR